MLEQVLAGDTRALAKAITVVENDLEDKERLLAGLFKYTGKAYVVGITGSPGAGKSSLVDKLTGELRKYGKTVGIVAVDPSSPFTGGALLGDRIRMQEHVMDRGVFIRSMGTRGSLGGLARATKEVVKVLDAFGKDMILVETVGVGQSELDVMNAVDTTVVVLTPGAGDVVQTLKAGIMEIADIFVINKSDLPGADRIKAEVETMLDFNQDREWRPPVVSVVSVQGTGISVLYGAIEKHKHYLLDSNKLLEKRRNRNKGEVIEIILEHLKHSLSNSFQNSAECKQVLHQVMDKEMDPYTAAHQILSHLKNAP